MAEAYRSQDDLHQRLDGTICFWEDEPYYVRTHGGRDTVYPKVGLYRMDLDTPSYNAYKKVDHTDSKFVDRSPRLGYMNHNGRAYYVSRVPYRYNNQAVAQRSLTSTCGGLPMNEMAWFSGKPMYNCIKGIYPSVTEAFASLDSRAATGVGVSRDWAIKRLDGQTTGLYFKDRLASLWNPRSRTWEHRDSSDSNIVRKLMTKTGLFNG